MLEVSTEILTNNVGTFMGSDIYGGITNDSNILSEYIQKYVLSTSDFAKGMQTGISHYVTRDRINNASFRQKLDTISKNTIGRQNPLELVFENILTFGAKSPIVGSLLKEVDVGKKDIASELIKKAPRPAIFDDYLKDRLNKLKDRPEPKDNDDNNLSSPPSPHFHLLHHHHNHLQDHHHHCLLFFHHHQQDFKNHYLNHLVDQVILFPFHQHHQHLHLHLMIIILWGLHRKHYLIIYKVLRHKN